MSIGQIHSYVYLSVICFHMHVCYLTLNMEGILAYKKVMKSLFYEVNERKLKIMLSHNVVSTEASRLLGIQLSLYPAK